MQAPLTAAMMLSTTELKSQPPSANAPGMKVIPLPTKLFTIASAVGVKPEQPSSAGSSIPVLGSMGKASALVAGASGPSERISDRFHSRGRCSSGTPHMSACSFMKWRRKPPGVLSCLASPLLVSGMWRLRDLPVEP